MGTCAALGVAWSPKKFNDKVVVRAGWGMYYDRGELFTYLSPGFASGVIAGGPFGVNQTPPWVNSQVLQPITATRTAAFRKSLGSHARSSSHGNPQDLILPQCSGRSRRAAAVLFCRLQPRQQAPLHMNQTLDIQWQPRNDLAIDIGYVGNLGRHEVVPLPFNQAQIASPTSPIRPGTPFEQDYTYGYSIVD